MSSSFQGPQGWSARFNEPVSELVKRFTASVTFDKRLAEVDIQGSLAHAKMLNKVGVLSAKDLADIERGMNEIATEIRENRFEWSIDREDVHMNIEAKLTALIGDAGKRLHTGRSRNDQVATDIRLWLRGEIDHIIRLLRVTQLALINLTEQHTDTVMPGYTHLQVAQPVTFGHHLMAYVEMLSRDEARMGDVRRRMNRLPLGAAALAGTTFPIDREFVARELSFDGVCENSLDAVSRRRQYRHDASVAVLRRADYLDESEFCIYRFGGSFLYRFIDHAAKEKPGCGRAGARQSGAREWKFGGAAYLDERPAADLQQRQSGR
jgi:argininosuccinate lyase